MSRELEINPLVNENRRREPRGIYCFCVAIAGTAAAVIGTGVSVAGAAGAFGSDQGASRPDLPEYQDTIDLPDFDATTGGKDYLAMLPQLREIASKVTKKRTRQREKMMPGSTEIMSQAGDTLLSLSRGEIPQDVVDRTNQIVAERAGGGYDPSNPDSYAGGTSQAVGDFARSIGQTSQQQVNTFLSAAPTWETLADQFVYSPEEALNGAMALLTARSSYALGQAGINLQQDQNAYAASLNTALGAAAPDPAQVAQTNTSMMTASAINSGISSLMPLLRSQPTPSSAYSGVGTRGYSAPGAPVNALDWSGAPTYVPTVHQ